MGWPIIAAAAIGAVGSYMASRNAKKAAENAPQPPEWDWIRNSGPGIWNDLRDQGREWMNNPYGLGESRAPMERIARDTATSGYEESQRNRDRSFALSGLDQAGGSAARQDYYGGRQMAEYLNQAMSGVEIADFQAKEEQRLRGANLLMSVSNKSPIYSQIVAQNYWNALQQGNQTAQGIGQFGSNMMNYYQNQQLMNRMYPQGQQTGGQQSTQYFMAQQGNQNSGDGGGLPFMGAG